MQNSSMSSMSSMCSSSVKMNRYIGTSYVGTSYGAYCSDTYHRFYEARNKPLIAAHQVRAEHSTGSSKGLGSGLEKNLQQIYQTYLLPYTSPFYPPHQFCSYPSMPLPSRRSSSQRTLVYPSQVAPTAIQLIASSNFGHWLQPSLQDDFETLAGECAAPQGSTLDLSENQLYEIWETNFSEQGSELTCHKALDDLDPPLPRPEKKASTATEDNFPTVPIVTPTSSHDSFELKRGEELPREKNGEIDMTLDAWIDLWDTIEQNSISCYNSDLVLEQLCDRESPRSVEGMLIASSTSQSPKSSAVSPEKKRAKKAHNKEGSGLNRRESKVSTKRNVDDCSLENRHGTRRAVKAKNAARIEETLCARTTKKGEERGEEEADCTETRSLKERRQAPVLGQAVITQLIEIFSNPGNLVALSREIQAEYPHSPTLSIDQEIICTDSTSLLLSMGEKKIDVKVASSPENRAFLKKCYELHSQLATEKVLVCPLFKPFTIGVERAEYTVYFYEIASSLESFFAQHGATFGNRPCGLSDRPLRTLGKEILSKLIKLNQKGQFHGTFGMQSIGLTSEGEVRIHFPYELSNGVARRKHIYKNNALYAPPEANSHRYVDNDSWALCAVLFELLTYIQFQADLVLDILKIWACEEAQLPTLEETPDWMQEAKKQGGHYIYEALKIAARLRFKENQELHASHQERIESLRAWARFLLRGLELDPQKRASLVELANDPLFEGI